MSARPGAEAVEVTRVMRAGRERVWRAWTEPALLRRWFGSPGYTLEDVEIDLRVGGRFRMAMRTAEGDALTVAGEYRVVEEPSRLVYTWNVTGAGRELRGSVVTVGFDERDGATEVRIRHEGLAEARYLESHEKGWTTNLSQLDGFLAEDVGATP